MIDSSEPEREANMSDDKTKVTDKAGEIAKNIWLAGLGAYGKAIDEAQDRLEKATKEPPRLFKDLVKKGEALEQEVKETLSSAREFSSNTVEERIRKVRENFSFTSDARSEELAEIHDKLDTLTAKVDALAAAMKPARKTAPRAKSPRKPKA
ncbi:MAG: phasin family protein [Halieaceae bacterium]|nr:phasin family protein [Halieaceae bacterium]